MTTLLGWLTADDPEAHTTMVRAGDYYVMGVTAVHAGRGEIKVLTVESVPGAEPRPRLRWVPDLPVALRQTEWHSQVLRVAGLVVEQMPDGVIAPTDRQIHWTGEGWLNHRSEPVPHGPTAREVLDAPE